MQSLTFKSSTALLSFLDLKLSMVVIVGNLLDVENVCMLILKPLGTVLLRSSFIAANLVYFQSLIPQASSYKIKLVSKYTPC